MRSRALMLIAAAGPLASLAIAPGMLRADEPKRAESTPADTEALRGPTVPTANNRPTLIERNFDGRVVPVSGDPVQVALRRMDLDASTREKCQRIFDQRNAILDGIVQNNLPAIVALANARKAGDRDETRRQFRALYAKADALTGRAPLIDEVAAVLPAAKVAELRAMVDDYRAALAEDRARNADTDNPDLARLPEARRELVADFGRQIRESYERVFGQRRERFQALLKELNLSPEQEAKVQQIATDAFQKNLGKETHALRASIFFEIYKELDSEQRAILVEKVWAERKAERAAPAAEPADQSGGVMTPANPPAPTR